jgi:hypothetical protein
MMAAMPRPLTHLALVPALLTAAACNEQFRGTTQPTSDTDSFKCQLDPVKRQPGDHEIAYTLACTAKKDLKIHNVEGVLYEGDKPSNEGPHALTESGEDIELKAGERWEKRDTFSPATVDKPWVIHARAMFNYPSPGVDVFAAIEAADKDRDKNPKKYRLDLSAAVP